MNHPMCMIQEDLQLILGTGAINVVRTTANVGDGPFAHDRCSSYQCTTVMANGIEGVLDQSSRIMASSTGELSSRPCSR
jgi:hypothetical protein